MMPSVDVYDLFIKDKGDVLGQIAYALYKKDKRDYIRRKITELNVEEIAEGLISDFKQISSSADAIERYRSQAKEISREFFHEATRDSRMRIESAYFKDYARLARNSSLWGNVLASVIGSIMSAFIGYLLLRFSGVWDILLTKLLG